MLGIFGEYLARMHFRTMDRPSSVILEVLEHKDIVKENEEKDDSACR
ncbi:MAG: hypothetical protein BWZ01_01591 [Deltaproteobacteria bacterium ADurb.BinA179]|nr:MAG: hypothetical protein BWZ01_01591 [Deltaproteobacteria bacterium ADurb.BinA179]